VTLTTGVPVLRWQDCTEVPTMNKIQAKGGYKTQRKRRARVVAFGANRRLENPPF